MDGFDEDDGKYIELEFKRLTNINWVSIVISVVFVLLILTAVGVIIYKCCKKPKRRSETIVYGQQTYQQGYGQQGQAVYIRPPM